MKDPILAGYATALNWQGKIRQFLASAEGQRYCGLLAFQNTNVRDAATAGQEFTVAQSIDWIREKLDRSLISDAVYWIDPAMCVTLGEVAATIPRWTFQLDALPTPTGFCWLGKTMNIQAHMGGEPAFEPFRGLGWVTFYKQWIPDTTPVTFFSPAGDEIVAEVHTTFDPAELVAGWRTETRIGLYFLLEEPDGQVAPGFLMEWPVGQDVPHFHCTFPDRPAKEVAFWADVSVGLMRYFAALCVFLQQDILTTTPTRIPRALQRHFAGRKTVTEPVVRVITLRKRRYETSAAREDGPRDWSCQWLVSGHWRKQWYARQGIHQPRWIAPYLKGPDDKPLKAPGRKVFAVVR